MIGGRGTGKSTVLEYVRWALCDQPPKGDEDETPNYQARRSRLIDATLKRFEATVDITYVLNEVRHVVRRNALDGRLLLKIGGADYQPCSEEDVRALLPIQAYSQKQLSDVSVRLEELTRFITGPIRGDLDRLKRLIADRANRIREAYATRQRYRDLSREVQNRELEERSIAEQASTIRTSLAGLTDEDRAKIEQGPAYGEADALVASWKAGLGTLQQKSEDLRRLVRSQRDTMRSVPEQPAEMNEVLRRLKNEYQDLLEGAETSLRQITESVTSVHAGEAWAAWDAGYAAFGKEYDAATERSSSQTDKLHQLRDLERRSTDISAEMTRAREVLATLAAADADFDRTREEWLNAQAEHDGLIDRECADLTRCSGDLIRVHVKRHADATSFVAVLRASLQGSRLQSAKMDAIGQGITEAADPKSAWLRVLSELEALAEYDSERSLPGEKPSSPSLGALGLNAGDLDRIAKHLTPDDWLNLSLTMVTSIPVYQFRSREGEYIPFENASAGQQATALLRTLLCQGGPPLIIDQPEEDLDNPVMLEIVREIWTAKATRQIIFASHNANLVVNGDAELVAWFGHRVSGDQSRGTIQGAGAIDVPATREAIKQIMEGGESAFRLRREKYGF